MAFAAIMIVLVAVGVRLRKHKHVTPTSTPPVVELVKTPKGKTTSKPGPKEIAANKEILNKAVTLAQHEGFLSLASLPRSAPELQVNIEPLLDCSGLALFDLLRAQMSHGKQSKQHRLLLSLETVEPRNNTPPAASKEILVGTLRKPFQTKFAVAAVKQPALLGLFLCTDKEHAGRCAGKAVNAVHTREDFYKAYKGQEAPPEQGDAIFYFKAVILGNDQRWIQIAAPHGDAHTKVLNEWLQPDFGSADAKNLAKMVTKLNDGTSSSPLGIDQNTVTIKIGYSDGLCWQH